MLRRVVLVVALVLGSCSGDDGGDGDATTDTSAAVVTQPGGDPAAQCDLIQVLLKLDISDEQRDDVAGELDGIEGVSYELVEAAAETEPAMFLVTAESDQAADAVGTALAGHPAVVSVVFPEQLC